MKSGSPQCVEPDFVEALGEGERLGHSGGFSIHHLYPLKILPVDSHGVIEEIVALPAEFKAFLEMSDI